MIKSPISNFGGFPKPNPHLPMATTEYQAPVNVASDNLRSLTGTDSDPVAMFLGSVSKLLFLSQVKPSLDKDLRLVQAETFFKVLFGRNKTRG